MSPSLCKRLQSPELIVAHDDVEYMNKRSVRWLHAHVDDLLKGSTAHWLSITIGWVVVAACQWSHVYHSS